MCLFFVVTDSFTYDSNGNRTSGIIQGSAFSATYDDQDRILTYGSRTYNYNNNGDLSRIQWNVTDKTDFVYDVLGNLKQVTLPTGTVLTYSMDGLNNRVYKTAAGSYNYRYLYDDQKRVVAHISGANALTKEFIYASRQTVPDYMITGGNKFRIISDHLGSPRLVVRIDSGVVVQRIDYNTLGLVTADSSPGFQPYAFAGGIHDTHTQLVKFGARDYDPRSTGRWMTKDPIGFDGGDVNLYGYVLNDPINFVDPSGLMGMPLPRLPEGGGEKAPSEADSDCKKNKPNPKYRIRILPGYDPGGVRGSFF